jgi:ASC-1-like (ASCH) protein
MSMPVRHRMKLTPENFDHIHTGDKHFEFRLNDEKRKALQIGERVEFLKLPELEKDVIVEITSLKVFKDFHELYQNMPEATGAASEIDFIQSMRTHYTEDEEKKYGVVAIGIRPI